MHKFLFPVVLLGTVVMIVVMFKTGRPLTTPTTPAGILNLEMAFNQANTDRILLAWTPTATQPDNKIAAAKINTYWDFLFLLFYTAFLYMACKKLASGYREETGFAKAGHWLAKAALAVGGLDVVENLGMLQLLGGNGSNTLALATSVVSVIKWILAFFCVLYVLLSAPLMLYYQKLRP